MVAKVMFEIKGEFCPLCGKSNACEEFKCENKTNSKKCWCQSSEVVFPSELLDQLPEIEKNKRCICQRCLLDFKSSNS